MEVVAEIFKDHLPQNNIIQLSNENGKLIVREGLEGESGIFTLDHEYLKDPHSIVGTRIFPKVEHPRETFSDFRRKLAKDPMNEDLYIWPFDANDIRRVKLPPLSTKRDYDFYKFCYDKFEILGPNNGDAYIEYLTKHLDGPQSLSLDHNPSISRNLMVISRNFCRFKEFLASLRNERYPNIYPNELAEKVGREVDHLLDPKANTKESRDAFSEKYWDNLDEWLELTYHLDRIYSGGQGWQDLVYPEENNAFRILQNALSQGKPLNTLLLAEAILRECPSGSDVHQELHALKYFIDGSRIRQVRRNVEELLQKGHVLAWLGILKSLVSRREVNNIQESPALDMHTVDWKTSPKFQGNELVHGECSPLLHLHYVEDGNAALKTYLNRPSLTHLDHHANTEIYSSYWATRCKDHNLNSRLTRMNTHITQRLLIISYHRVVSARKFLIESKGNPHQNNFESVSDILKRWFQNSTLQPNGKLSFWHPHYGRAQIRDIMVEMGVRPLDTLSTDQIQLLEANRILTNNELELLPYWCGGGIPLTTPLQDLFPSENAPASISTLDYISQDDPLPNHLSDRIKIQPQDKEFYKQEWAPSLRWLTRPFRITPAYFSNQGYHSRFVNITMLIIYNENIPKDYRVPQATITKQIHDLAKTVLPEFGKEFWKRPTSIRNSEQRPFMQVLIHAFSLFRLESLLGIQFLENLLIELVHSDEGRKEIEEGTPVCVDLLCDSLFIMKTQGLVYESHGPRSRFPRYGSQAIYQKAMTFWTYDVDSPDLSEYWTITRHANCLHCFMAYPQESGWSFVYLPLPFESTYKNPSIFNSSSTLANHPSWWEYDNVISKEGLYGSAGADYRLYCLLSDIRMQSRPNKVSIEEVLEGVQEKIEEENSHELGFGRRKIGSSFVYEVVRDLFTRVHKVSDRISLISLGLKEAADKVTEATDHRHEPYIPISNHHRSQSVANKKIGRPRSVPFEKITRHDIDKIKVTTRTRDFENLFGECPQERCCRFGRSLSLCRT